MATPAIVAALALWPGSAAAQAMPRGDHPMMGWGGMGWMGMLLWILVVAAVVLLVVALAKRIGGDARPPRAVLAGEHEPPAAEPPAAEPPAEPENGTEDASKPRGDRTGRRATPPIRVSDDSETVLQPYRERVETVEALGAADVATAAEILEQSGGLTGLEATAAKLDDDAATLRTLAAEATVLAARAEAATPPTETLRRLS